MKTETLHRREIWSKWLRLSHWTLALSTLALMATGWLVRHTPSVAQAAADWHYIAGGIFTLGLALRIWVLFSDKLMGRWQFLLADLEPKKNVANAEVLPLFRQSNPATLVRPQPFLGARLPYFSCADGPGCLHRTSARLLSDRLWHLSAVTACRHCDAYFTVRPGTRHRRVHTRSQKAVATTCQR
jgi:hypothetical protein